MQNEVGFRQQVAFLPGLLGEHHGLRKESQIGSRSIGATFAKKYGPKVGKAALTVLKTVAKK